MCVVSAGNKFLFLCTPIEIKDFYWGDIVIWNLKFEKLTIKYRQISKELICGSRTAFGRERLKIYCDFRRLIKYGALVVRRFF